MSYWA
jgi:hypothetical protein